MTGKTLVLFVTILLSALFSIHKLKAESLPSIDSTYFFIQEHLDQSMPDLALEKLFKLLEYKNVSEVSKDTLSLLIAEAYRQKREYQKGIDLLLGLVAKRTLEPFYIAKAYNRIAALYNEWADFPNNKDSVILYSDRCIKMAKENNFKYLLASSYNEIAYVYSMRNLLSEAEAKFKLAYSIYKDSHLDLYAANVAINLSGVYLKQKHYKASLAVVDNVLPLMESQNQHNMLMRLYLRKANIYEYANIFDSAYFYLSKARILQKRYFYDRMDQKINEMSAKYELETKKKEIEIVENRRLQEEREKWFYVILTIVLAIVLLSFAWLFVVKRKNLKQKHQISLYENALLSKQLDSNDKELTSSIAHRVAQKDLLKNIKKHLKENQQKEALDLINANIDTSIKWDNFFVNFRKNHPLFNSKLKATHPNLNENDLQICALLKMQLKSQEIAQILNVQLSSINKRRQRLRKKLNLDQNSDLFQYLNSL
ncbi:MAG: hypothetical protein JXR60_07215 [Bacteroidales bacterium]|nr:hypothetical protein [Bacteroidales bacterium]